MTSHMWHIARRFINPDDEEQGLKDPVFMRVWENKGQNLRPTYDQKIKYIKESLRKQEILFCLQILLMWIKRSAFLGKVNLFYLSFEKPLLRYFY